MNFLIKAHLKNNNEIVEKYARYIFIEKGLYYYHNDDNYIYAFKSMKSEAPEIKIDKDTGISYNIDEDTFFYKFVYSFDDIKNIKECDFDNIQQTLSDEIDRIQQRFRNDDLRNYVILANEGTGKSLAVLNKIQPGEIYSAPDKTILKEKEDYLKSINKEYIRFDSNGDIIYSIIDISRGNNSISKKIAEEIANDYIKQFDTSNIFVDVMKLNKLIQKYDRFITKEDGLNKILTRLDDEKVYDLSKNDKENIVSLLLFVDDHEDIKNEEKVAILEYYKYLTGKMFSGNVIITCTTHKLKILLQKMNYGRPLLIYSDEIVPDVHGNCIGINQFNKNYGFLFAFAKMNQTDIDPEIESKVNNIKKKRGVKDWNVISSYNFGNGGHNTLIELKEDRCMNDISMVILSTEEKCKFIFPSFELIDLRHTIDSDITFLVVDGLNKKEKEKYFKGAARPIITKTAAQTIFDIKNDFFIGDGIGHNLQSSTFNHTNVKGRNTFIKKLKNNVKTNVGITIMNPHPENINMIKGYILNANYDKFTNQKLTPNEILNQFEEDIIQIIGTDQVNQSIGRCNGYRKYGENKTYVIINSNMMKKIKPKYFTENVFTVSRFRNCKWLREKFPKEHLFLELITFLLRMKDDNIDTCNLKNITTEKVKQVAEIINNKLISKYNNELNLYSIFKKFQKEFKKYVDYVKSKINKISFVPKMVETIQRYFHFKKYGYSNIKNCKLKFALDDLNIIDKSNLKENWIRKWGFAPFSESICVANRS